METDPHRLEQRQKQIDFGLATQGYRNYITWLQANKGKVKPIPIPNPYAKSSKRSWDNQIRHWRRMLHLWDSVEHPPVSPDTDFVHDMEMEGYPEAPAMMAPNNCDVTRAVPPPIPFPTRPPGMPALPPGPPPMFYSPLTPEMPNPGQFMLPPPMVWPMMPMYSPVSPADSVDSLPDDAVLINSEAHTRIHLRYDESQERNTIMQEQCSALLTAVQRLSVTSPSTGVGDPLAGVAGTQPGLTEPAAVPSPWGVADSSFCAPVGVPRVAENGPFFRWSRDPPSPTTVDTDDRPFDVDVAGLFSACGIEEGSPSTPGSEWSTVTSPCTPSEYQTDLTALLPQWALRPPP